jgi:DNA-binding CsgD family transcriptional regulator
MRADLSAPAGAPRSRNYTRLSAEQRARVKAEIARSPKTLGYARTFWSGELLSAHLRSRYGIRLSERQGRRLLRAFGVAPGPPRRNQPPGGLAKPVVTCADTLSFNSATLVGSARRHELALRKIRRLASSGLPLHLFVLTLFDLIAEAIPAGDLARAMWTDAEVASSWVFANLDQSKWVPVLAELTARRDPSALPCFRPREQLTQTRQALFMLEEFTLPDYRRSALYNDFLRPLKLEQGVLMQLMAHGQLVGYYPLFRSSTMKLFDRDDRRFLNAAAPHIAHGLQNAKLLNALTDSADRATSVEAPGVIVMNRDGRILGMDQQARALLFQVAMHDAVRWSAFAEPQLRLLLDYVARTLSGIFDKRERSSAEIAPPTARIFSHRAGIVLKFTGHVTLSNGGQEPFVVLVEQLEPEAFRRARLMYRYGLAPREAEMLIMLRQGPSVARVARELGISIATAKTYVRNLTEKLGVTDSTALRSVS